MDIDHKALLGPRFEKALQLALQLHGTQVRKNLDVPYIAHLLTVTALVLQDGGNEDEAIAALLHDAAEDQGGEETLKLIREIFGETVSGIVEVCSDTFDFPKPPWRSRKEAHLKAIKNAPRSVHRVILADKLHNARSLLHDLKVLGNEVWDMFNGGKEGSIWYFQSMHQLLAEAHPGYMADQLGQAIIEIKALS